MAIVGHARRARRAGARSRAGPGRGCTTRGRPAEKPTFIGLGGDVDDARCGARGERRRCRGRARRAWLRTTHSVPQPALGFDRMGEKVGQRHRHQVQLGIQLLADALGDRDGDVHDGEGRVHADPVPAQDAQHVEQHLAHLHLAQALAPVAAHELDDRGAETFEGPARRSGRPRTSSTSAAPWCRRRAGPRRRRSGRRPGGGAASSSPTRPRSSSASLSSGVMKMLPGCRSACTKPSSKIIFSRVSQPEARHALGIRPGAVHRQDLGPVDEASCTGCARSTASR